MPRGAELNSTTPQIYAAFAVTASGNVTCLKNAETSALLPETEIPFAPRFLFFSNLCVVAMDLILRDWPCASVELSFVLLYIRHALLVK